MTASPSTSSATLATALRQLHPSAMESIEGSVSLDALAALSECATALSPLFSALSGVSAACSRGDAAGAADALRALPAAVTAAESAFLRTCAQHRVSPDAVVASLRSTRQLLEVIAAGPAPALPT